MENSGAAATIVSPAYLHSDHVKNEKSNSFLDFLVVRQRLAITNFEISSLLPMMVSYVYLEITLANHCMILAENHPICLHRTLDVLLSH